VTVLLKLLLCQDACMFTRVVLQEAGDASVARLMRLLVGSP